MLRKIAAMIVGGLALSASITAQAQDKPASGPPSAPASWWDTFSISGHIEGGMTFNTYPQNNGLNFGQLFTDKT
ncbi:MAG: porin, partial [Alphaproteobacteria bacterium]|nr:porin [Alphaproteobacteria bacterium]